MSEQNIQKTDVLAVMARLLMITLTLLSPIALIRDCAGGTTDGKTEASDSNTAFPGATGNEISGRQQPKGKTMREYLILEIGIKNPSDPKAKAGLDKLEVEAQRFYDKDLKAAKNSERFHLILGSQKYISVAAKRVVEKNLEKHGRKLDDEYLIPVLDLSGKVFVDTRKFHEEIWMSRTAAELMMEANREYNEQTGDQFVFAAGARSPERQAISQALWYTHCEGKWTTKIKKLFGYKCEKSMGSEVGSCFGTAHHPGFAVDMNYGKMKNPKLAREILAKKGFLVYCDVDKPHVDWSKDKCW